MSISTLAKVNILFHDENKEQLIHRLQELACIHVVDFKETVIAKSHEDLIIKEELSDTKLEKSLNDLRFAITCLSPFRKESGLLSMIAGKKVVLSKKEYQNILESFNESEIVKKVIALEKEEHKLLSEITNNETVMRELDPWKGLDIDIEGVKDTETTCVRLGKLPANKLGNLKKSLEKITTLYELMEINAVGESVYVLICFMKEFEL
jgi:vacuolar-type H+-ATPase subunit I/STV1